MEAIEDDVRFSRPAHLAGMELVSAQYRQRAFPTHSHDEFVIGAMTLGAERLAIGGRRYVAAKGDLILFAPGEAHSNEGVGSAPFGYTVMYMPAPLLAEAFPDADVCAVPASFREPVVRLPHLHRKLLQTCRNLARTCGALQQQSLLHELIGHLFDCDELTACRLDTREPAKIRLAREYIDGNFCEQISLSFLSSLTGLSPFHLTRSFKRQVGLSPSRYQTQLRINRVKTLLKDGEAIAEVAACVGFADQSHLTRQFQQVVGTTPKRYQSAQATRAA